MKLVGMPDSPYVRRVLIAAQLLEIPLEHEALSVFGDFHQFHQINPAVRAPTLVLDGGELLMDSGMILQYLDDIAAPRSLLPTEAHARLRCLRFTGLATTLADKSIQLYHELVVRPEPSRWPEWITRLTGQLRDTCALLEHKADPRGHAWLCAETPTLADITTAVAWRFTHHVLPHLLDRNDYPRLDALSDMAEALPAFLAVPLE